MYEFGLLHNHHQCWNYIICFALSSIRWLVLNMWCPTLFWWAEGSSILWIISIWIGTQLPVLYLLSRCNKMKISLRNKKKGEKRASSPRQHYWDYMGGHIFQQLFAMGWNSLWRCFPSCWNAYCGNRRSCPQRWAPLSWWRIKRWKSQVIS